MSVVFHADLKTYSVTAGWNYDGAYPLGGMGFECSWLPAGARKGRLCLQVSSMLWQTLLLPVWLMAYYRQRFHAHAVAGWLITTGWWSP